MNTRKRAKTRQTRDRRRRARISELRKQWHRLTIRKWAIGSPQERAITKKMGVIDRAMDHHLALQETPTQKVSVG